MRENGFNPLSREDYLSFKKWLMYTNIDSFPTGQRSTGLSKSNSDWELLHKMEIRWNRLALFPSNMFHSPLYSPDSGGSQPDRSTMNLFLTKC